ncbi:DUF1493 family protein [Methylobacter luteus]|uniref:DUF1493 family protein n=1 Tax=Methylobacter luteus TaxID=415 RepID=UPI000481CB0B|nr:DUF1493 family protein [Methylobacter luteus]
MPRDISLANLVKVIQECQGFSQSADISERMLLEKDLGITGDDGDDLFDEIERQFSISVFCENYSIRDAFGMTDNQCFFHSEGYDPFLNWLRSLFGETQYEVKDITVGQLYEAIVKIKERQNHG